MIVRSVVVIDGVEKWESKGELGPNDIHAYPIFLKQTLLSLAHVVVANAIPPERVTVKLEIDGIEQEKWDRDGWKEALDRQMLTYVPPDLDFKNTEGQG